MKSLMIRSMSEPMIIMGLFDRFRKDEVVEPQKEISIELSTLKQWSDKEFGSDQEQALATIKSLHSDIMSSYEDIRRDLKSLEEASFEEDDKRYTAANMVKNTFVNKTNNILKTETGVELKYSTLKSFYLNSIKNIRELTTLSPKQMVLLTSYFNDQTRKITESVKSTEAKLNKLKDFLDSKGKVVWLKESIEKESQEQKEAIDNYMSLGNNIEKKKEEIERTDADVKKNSENLKNLLKDPAWKEFEKLDKEIYYSENKLSETRDALEQVAVQINKPLKKLEYAISHGYSPGQGTTLINRFLENAFKSILEEDGIDNLKQVLTLLRQANKDRKEVMKPKDEQKILDLIRRCGSDLPILTKKYVKITHELEQKRSIKKNLHPEILSRREELEQKIKDQKKEIELLHKDMKYIEEDMNRLLEDINSRKTSLEKRLSDHLKAKVTISQSV